MSMTDLLQDIAIVALALGSMNHSKSIRRLSDAIQRGRWTA